MKECIPEICNYEYCRQRSVDDKLFKEAVKALEYWSYISFGRSKKHHIVVSNKLNEGIRNMRFQLTYRKHGGKASNPQIALLVFCRRPVLFQPCFDQRDEYDSRELLYYFGSYFNTQ